MFASIKSRLSLKMGYVGSKTSSLGQILEKTPKRPHFSSDTHETWSECLL